MRRALWVPLLQLSAAVAAAYPAAAVQSDAGPYPVREARVASNAEPMVQQLMLRLRRPTALERSKRLDATRVAMLSGSAGVNLHSKRPMSGGATVLALPQRVTLAEAQRIAARLMADADVEYAEPDVPVHTMQVAVTPPDASYLTRQWNLAAVGSVFPSGGSPTPARQFDDLGTANLPSAWNSTKGSAGVNVAVIDSGVTLTHPDLMPAIISGSGYDFVSKHPAGTGAPDFFIANDGTDRDPDPTDPGDWVDSASVTASNGECSSSDIHDSDWHGTHMSGVIAAAWTQPPSPAGTGIAGMAPNVRIVPVRALGRCGGSSSDVIDAMRWAAGLPPDQNGGTWASLGIPVNAYPAKVLNLSLGGGSCGQSYGAAVNEIVAAGAVIAAATGNGSNPNDPQLLKQPVIAPASCPGAIAVTAHVINGDSATYANVGMEVAVSAPGGGDGYFLPVVTSTNSPIFHDGSDSAYFVWSTSLFGATDPASASSSCSTCTGPALVGFTGTSPATPHVSAAAALLFSLSPKLSPAEILDLIQKSARAFPAGSYCVLNAGQCGAGMLDVSGAVALHESRRPVVDAGLAQTVASGAAVTLSASISSPNSSAIASESWSQLSGPTVTLANASSATATFTAPATTAATDLLFRITAVDSKGYQSSATTTVSVQAGSPSPAPAPAPPPAPSGSSGGGGVFALWQLLVLALLGLVVRRAPRRT